MNQTYQRQTRSAQEPVQPTSFDLGDIYYVLFRRWKLILFLGLLSVPAAVLVYLKTPPIYTSEAKLMVRYIQDRKAVAPNNPDSVVTVPDSRGEDIMNSELEILSSADLVESVVEQVGAEKILAKYGGGTNRFEAAALLGRGVAVENPKKSKILLVSISHPDPAIVQPALQSLIEAYVGKHVEIHQNKGVMDEILKRQREVLRTALGDTESELIRIQTNSGIVSVEESKRSLSAQISKLEEDITTAEVELAAAQITAKAAGERSLPVGSTTAVAPPAVAAPPPPAPDVASAPSSISTNTPASDVPQDKVDGLLALDTELETLRKLEKLQLRSYTELHPSVKRTRALIAETQNQIQKAEAGHEGLRALAAVQAATKARSAASPTPTMSPSFSQAPAGFVVDPAQEALARVAIIESRLKTLRSYHEKLRASISGLVDAEYKIGQLKRKKELQETSFRYYESGLNQAAADEALGPGKVTGLTQVQTPSLPRGDARARNKLIIGSLFLPWLLALALAFILELFMDRTVRRASDVEKKAGVPLFVSIPERSSMKSISWSPVPQKILPLPGAGPGDEGIPSEATDASLLFPAVPESGHGLDVYFETLRDRITSFFERNSMTHKPKLLGITGCQSEVGVTSIVAGLAASLSKSDEGNVLVVDMKTEGGAVKFFRQGKEKVGLLDALDEARRSDAQVGENLFVVSETQDNGGMTGYHHKKFLGLVPKLKLSSYDYIIFDLPTMSQTSISPRMARFMDLVLVVAESERTPGEFLRESAKLLSESGTNVGAILNKTRSYVPKRFSQQLDESA